MYSPNVKKQRLCTIRSENPDFRCKGFTLLEILLVVFLLSLMLALAVPSVSVLGESSIKSEAKRIASIVRYLNDTAVSKKEIVTLKVDFRERSFVYEVPGEKKREKFSSVVSAEMLSKGSVSEGELIIPFGPMGASEPFRFLLRDDETTMTVSFHHLSGRVKIMKHGG